MFVALAALLVSSQFSGEMVYQCFEASGASRYTDQLCTEAEQCKKWGPKGWSIEECEAEKKARYAPPPAPQVSNSPALAAPAPAARSSDACGDDLQCWGDQYQLDATHYCRPVVENHAKYQFRWEDGWLDQKFPRFRWGDHNHSTLTYVGDQISMQNGFGAWQRMSYSCTYDPSAKRVIDVEVRPRNG